MEKIQERYVPREMATVLQAIGFEWACNTYYTADEADSKVYFFTHKEKENLKLIMDKFGYVLAPTLSMVQKWLREVKNTNINCNYDESRGRYFVTLYILNNIYKRVTSKEISGIGEYFDTYEDAIYAGILVCLKIINEINKIKKNKINPDECPKNDVVTFYYPDGTEIVKTDNDLMFNYIRNEIKKRGISNCYLVMQKGLNKIKIDKYGNLESWPSGFYQNCLNILNELTGSKPKNNNSIIL